MIFKKIKPKNLVFFTLSTDKWKKGPQLSFWCKQICPVVDYISVLFYSKTTAWLLQEEVKQRPSVRFV